MNTFTRFSYFLYDNLQNKKDMIHVGTVFFFFLSGFEILNYRSRFVIFSQISALKTFCSNK